MTYPDGLDVEYNFFPGTGLWKEAVVSGTVIAEFSGYVLIGLAYPVNKGHSRVVFFQSKLSIGSFMPSIIA